MRFEERAVVVTGGGSGIGRVLTQMFAGEGASVVAADWNRDGAEETVEIVTGAGGRALAVEADVSSWADAQRMVAAAVETFGRLDILVNNAAIARGDGILETDPATWDQDVSVTLTSQFLCTRAALPTMIERGSGVFVNITSVNALSALGNEAYSAAKAGVISLTRSVAVAHGRSGIRANAIAPGTIRTPIWGERIAKDPAVFEKLVKWYPLGRIGEPEDVARAALFLASDDASWITGTVLTVDGGLLAGNDVMTAELVVREG